MKPKTTFFVVLVTAAILAFGFTVALVVGRTLQFAREKWNSETARQEYVARWQPPENAKPEALFPNDLLGRFPSNVLSQVTAPELGLNHPGAQATYNRPGAEPIDVRVLAPGTADAAAVFQRAKALYDAAQGNKSFLQFNQRVRVTLNQPVSTFEVWELKGWLFVFQGPGQLEAVFIRTYLDAISSAPPGGRGP